MKSQPEDGQHIGPKHVVYTYCTTRWNTVVFDCMCTIQKFIVIEPTQRGWRASKLFVNHDLRYCCWDLDINIWLAMHNSTIGPECTGVHCTQHNSFESCMGKYYSKIITSFEKWSYIKRFNLSQSRCGIKKNKFKEIINRWVNYQCLMMAIPK